MNTKLNHLRAAQTFVKKVAMQRRRMYKMHVSGRAESVKMHMYVEGFLYMSSANNFDSMMRWLEKEETKKQMELLIPSNNKAWRREYYSLLHQGRVLLGRIIKQGQLQFENSN